MPKFILPGARTIAIAAAVKTLSSNAEAETFWPLLERTCTVKRELAAEFNLPFFVM